MPAALSSLGGRVALGTALTILPLVLAAYLAEFWLSDADRTVVTTMLIYVSAVVGIGMFSGNSGVLSFGHVGFMALGAYGAGLLVLSPALKATELPNLPAFLADAQWPLLPGLGVGVALAVVCALLLARPVSRLPNAAAVIATLAFLVIVNVVLVGTRDWTRGAQTLYGFTADITWWGALLAASLTIVGARLFRESSSGLQLRASREDELAAEALGVNVRRRRAQAWVLSAIPLAVAGALYGQLLAAFSPNQFYFTLTFSLLAMLIVGGLTTVSGAAAGAVLVTFLSDRLSAIEDAPDFLGLGLPRLFGFSQVAVAILMLLVLVYRRDGIFGRREPDELLLGLWWRRRSKHELREPISGTKVDALAAPAAAPSNGGSSKPPLPTRGSDDARVEVSDLEKHFGGVPAVDGISFTVAPGEIVGLIGPNGSGKTTTLNAISGLVEPSSGRVAVDGVEMAGSSSLEFTRAGIARTFQNIRLFGRLTTLENVEVALGTAGGGSRQSRVADARALLEQFEIEWAANREAATLPYGTQRRLEIARALATDPTYLFLDEPAAGLNEAESSELLRTLQAVHEERGLGILIVDHSMNLIMSLCHRVVVLANGRLLADAPAEIVRTDPKVIEAYLGETAQI